MRVGLQLPEVERVVRRDELAAMARAAEECGFDSVWVGDHLLYRGDGRPSAGPWDCWTTLAWLAGITERVELGPLVACTAFHPPGILARQAAAIDELSGGRLVAALGAGWNQEEFRAFGVPFDHHVSRFEEAFTIVRRLLAGERVTFDGRFHAVRDAVLLPPPLRRPKLMIGANAPRMLSIALPHVDAWNTWYTHYGNTPEGFAATTRRSRPRRSGPGATRRRSSAAPVCSSRSSRPASGRATSRRCRPTGCGSPARARRGRARTRRSSSSTRSRSRRSARWRQTPLVSDTCSKSDSQRPSSASRSSRACAVRGEQVGVAPVGRELLLELGDPGLGARDLLLDELERGRLRLRRPFRLLALRLRRRGEARRLGLLGARVVGPAARVGRRSGGARPRAGGRPRRRAARGRARRAGRCPGNASSAASSDSRDSRSRWFVGSSSTRRFAPEATTIASASRRRSPPDSTAAGFSCSSQPEKRNWPSSDWASGRFRPGAGHRRVEHRAALVELGLVLGEVRGLDAVTEPDACPPAGLRSPRIVSSSVVLPEPFGPTSATCSPRSIANDAPVEQLLVARPQRRGPPRRATSRPDRAGFRNSKPSVRRLSSGACTRTASSFLICLSFDCACRAFDAL